MWTPLRNDEMLDYKGDALQGHLGVEDKPHHFSRCDLPFPLIPHPTSNNTCPAKEEWPALYGVCVLCTRLTQSAFTGLVVDGPTELKGFKLEVCCYYRNTQLVDNMAK